MAQQPKFEIDPAAFPRPPAETTAARRWSPSMRPGMITSPDQVPTGPSFGRPGPDTGYALRLIRQHTDFDEAELDAVLVTLMGARAAGFGRAPTLEDLEVAKVLLGYGDGVPAWVVDRRLRWLGEASHEKVSGSGALAEIDPDLLRERPDRIRYALIHQRAEPST